MEKLKLIGREVTLELAMAVCTNISFQEFINYIDACKSDEGLVRAVELLYSLFDRGYSVMDILDTFFLFVKTTSILNETEKYAIIPIVCKYITIFNDVHEDEIELALFTNNVRTVFSTPSI